MHWAPRRHCVGQNNWKLFLGWGFSSRSSVTKELAEMLSEAPDYERTPQWGGSFRAASRVWKVSSFPLCQRVKIKSKYIQKEIKTSSGYRKGNDFDKGQRKDGFSTEEVEGKLSSWTAGYPPISSLVFWQTQYRHSHENTFHKCIKLSYEQEAAIIEFVFSSSGDRKSDADSYRTIGTSVEPSAPKRMMLIDRNVDSKRIQRQVSTD